MSISLNEADAERAPSHRQTQTAFRFAEPVDEAIGLARTQKGQAADPAEPATRAGG